ncbi:aldolase/citrate lyase family protein [Sphingomonas naphthae]|uniref:Aldolase/citrate lyase family protein n=1 Tax=Sphingomonas naphthae TaxID=1813468 RepID=A0ABY7TQF8_9SPHN|nr:aldolase/citrate lyase family protein [Sphingomonas naphthae]WCT75180.1 aldolase/citrate lyase family protein [Sphingomonas naphthae]
MSALPRSWLFTPGSRPDRFAKAAATGADALILDLEDAVAEDRKVEARGHVIAFLDSAPAIAQAIAVRINPLGRAVGLEDLAALARLSRAPDYILVPKAEEPAELALVARVLDDAGSTARIAALVESARGIANAPALARATPRLAAMLFGAADYAADLGQQVGSFQPDFARAALVNAAAGGGVIAIDSPFFAIDRPDDLAAECGKVRALGYQGKAATHPAQLDPINAAFAPTADEQALARRILAAAPDGVGVLDGKMIDIAMVRWARRIA